MRSLEFHLVMSLGNISSESDRSSGEKREGLQHLDQGRGPGGVSHWEARLPVAEGLRVASPGAPVLLWPVCPSPLGSVASLP